MRRRIKQMSENKKTAFEEVFYAFLKRAMNNPSLLLTLYLES